MSAVSRDLDEFGRIDALLAEMRQALLEEAADGAEDLQVVGDGCVVERKGHGVSLPIMLCRSCCDTIPGIRADCNQRGGAEAGCEKRRRQGARTVQTLPHLK